MIRYDITRCDITRVSLTRESKSSVWPPGMESPAKSLEMEEGSMDPEPLLCPVPLLLVSPGGKEVEEEEE